MFPTDIKTRLRKQTQTGIIIDFSVSTYEPADDDGAAVPYTQKQLKQTI